MVGVKDIEEILSIALYTGHIIGEKPVSVMLVANVESGKTALIHRFSQNRDIVYMQDFTAWGFLNTYGEALEMGKVKHILIPDFITPLSRAKETVKTLVAFLNGLIEEGIAEIQTYATRRPLKIGAPNACGLITAIAKGELEDSRHQWARIGFLSRVLPVSYEYEGATCVDILASIARQEYRNNDFIRLHLPDNPWKVHLPTGIAEKTIPYALSLSKAEKVYGFRKQKQLQTLMMGSALARGNETVDQEDFDKVVYLSRYVGLEYRKI